MLRWLRRPQRTAPPGPRWLAVAYARHQVEAEMLLDILRQHGIPGFYRRTMGVDVPAFDDTGSEIRFRGVGLQGLRRASGVLDCGNSGTTARLMMGILAGQSFSSVLDGDESQEPAADRADQPGQDEERDAGGRQRSDAAREQDDDPESDGPDGDVDPQCRERVFSYPSMPALNWR